MAFRAELTFDKMKFRVLDYNYNMQRPTDYATGQVSGRMVAGRVTFLVELVPGQSLWPYIQTNKPAPTASVVLKGGDKDSALKTIEFTNAYVIDMTEDFNAVGGQPATLRFTISAEKMQESDSGVDHVNEWSNSANR